MDEETLLLKFVEWAQTQSIHFMVSRHISPYAKHALGCGLVRRFLETRPAVRVTYGKRPDAWIDNFDKVVRKQPELIEYMDIVPPDPPELRYPRSGQEYIAWQ